MTDDVHDKLRTLTDRAEISDCMQRYARGMDRQDRALLRSAYHDGAVDDHVGFVGPVDDFIDWAFAYHSTQTVTSITCSTTPRRSTATRRTRRPTTSSSAPTENPRTT
ncbi:nuclear transport factor 2 family protein [Mycolicibacterium pyrenivorans]|uniref:nuclear transport factor 2 family protein n=1 Tax=Mycolicibacterium pyrenivorans TaxID=187102 RepID=UPI003556952B